MTRHGSSIEKGVRQQKGWLTVHFHRRHVEYLVLYGVQRELCFTRISQLPFPFPLPLVLALVVGGDWIDTLA